MLAVLCSLAAVSASAQMGAPGGIGAALTKLFGDVTAFSAKAEVRVLDKDQQEMIKGPMDFALLGNKVRVELDTTQFKNKAMPEGAASNLKQMGLAHVVTVIRPDKKLIYLIYPNHKAATSMTLPKEEAEAADKKTRLEKTALGKETIDGHPCVKNKVIVSDEKGPILHATTWNATDLKDFPIQIETKEQGNTSVVLYKNVQFEKPEEKQFDVPAGYTEYQDQLQFMEAVTKKTSDAGKK
jgi:hypothetical protein